MKPNNVYCTDTVRERQRREGLMRDARAVLRSLTFEEIEQLVREIQRERNGHV